MISKSKTYSLLNKALTNIKQTYNYNIDNSKNYNITIGGDVNLGNTTTTTSNKTTNNVNVDYKFIGTAKADDLKGYSGDNYGDDLLDGGAGNDELRGARGSDFLTGGDGDDDVRGGNGRDTLTGGQGMDSLYGGFGINAFEDEDDGYADELYLKSDHLASNWIYGKAGNSPNGTKADKIGELDSIDKIYIQGAANNQLTFGYTDHTTPLGDSFSGIGIYASGVLEAVYTGSNHSLARLRTMVFGAEA